MCQRHGSFVRSVCQRLGATDADEATQAVFLVLARRGGTVNGDGLSSWLWSTARRVVANQRRSAVRQRRHEAQIAAELARQRSDEADESPWSEARIHLDDALASLSAGRREAILRFYFEGKPHAEVARELGCSVDAVKTRVYEGMQNLRAFLRRRGVVMSLLALATGLASECPAVEPASTAALDALECTRSPGAALLADRVSIALAVKSAASVSLGLLLATCLAVALWQVMPGESGRVPIRQVTAPEPVRSRVEPAVIPSAADAVLVVEGFEDPGFRSRGWYDEPGFITSGDGHAPGGARVAEFRFLQAAKVPLSKGPARRIFAAHDGIRVSFWIKHSPDWQTAGNSWCLIQLMTTADDRWADPSYTRFTCAIGLDQGVPYVSLQDPRNIDIGRIGQDLAGVTEDRATQGGNGRGDVFLRPDGRYWNANRIDIPEEALGFLRTTHRIDEWHRIELRIRFNSIEAGVGIPDGRLSLLVDGRKALERSDLLLRTARHADMQFSQLILAPWFGDGFPREQTLWIDDLTVSAEPDEASRRADPAP